jgi:membrane protein implicated in regulation of membrane protease activity
MGFCLSTLAAAIGVAQFLNQVIAFQWIFAFVIMAVLFIATVVVALPAVQNKKRDAATAPPVDQEHAPLLGDS